MTHQKRTKALKEDNSALHRFEKADRLLTLSFVGLLAALLPLRGMGSPASDIYVTVLLLFFTCLSGYTAFLHQKLPEKYRRKPNRRTFSIFRIHPCFTFSIFLLFTVFFLLRLWRIL